MDKQGIVLIYLTVVKFVYSQQKRQSELSRCPFPGQFMICNRLLF